MSPKKDNRRLTIGAWFIQNNQLSLEQAEEVLRRQRLTPWKKFGEIAVELGYIGYAEVNEYLAMLDRPLFPGEGEGKG
ncbi:MAG: hypothetical protein JW874_12915 [Spirochaetales bacterium]|nr:hypothetical protein [Spirochaetales bacterium]